MKIGQPSSGLIYTAAACLMAGIFAADLFLPMGAAHGLPYAALMLIAWWMPRNRDVWLLAVATTTLTITAHCVSQGELQIWPGVVDRGPAIFAIWIVAGLVAIDIGAMRDLRENQARLRAQFQGNPVPVYSWRFKGDDFYLADYNDAAVHATHGKVAKSVGAWGKEFFVDHPETAELIRRCWRERSNVQRTMEFDMVITGEKRILDFTYVYVPPDTVMSHLVDITERVAAEKALREANDRLERRVEERTADLRRATERLRREAEERTEVERALDKSRENYRVLVEQSPNAVLVHHDGKIVFANAAALQLFRADKMDDLLRIDPLSLVHEDYRDLVLGRRHEILAGQVLTLKTEMIRFRLDGTEFHAESSGSPIMWDGRPTYQIVVRDITERKLAEEAMREAKDRAERANAAKSRFLAAASHDLRQPIQALNLFVYSLGRKLAGDGESRELIENIRQTMEIMSSLLNALLDISKLEAGVVTPEFEDFPVDSVLDGVRTTLVEPARGIGIDFRTVATDRYVHSDPVLLERIVRNYVSNAVRYTESGRVLIGCRRRGDTVRIEVWDTGPGIPEAELDQIFEEFYQLENPARDRSRGLGLGLAIVERTARLLDHPIGVRSIAGKGSVFWIEVPAAEAQPARREAVADFDFPEGGDIVVIDDDRIVLTSLEGILSGAGFRVVAAADAGDALAKLRARQFKPELIVADHRLDGDETGIRAIDLIQQAIGQQIPAIIVTGDTAPDRLREATEGGHRLLHKPVRPETLLAAIGEILPVAVR